MYNGLNRRKRGGDRTEESYIGAVQDPEGTVQEKKKQGRGSKNGCGNESIGKPAQELI